MSREHRVGERQTLRPRTRARIASIMADIDAERDRCESIVALGRQPAIGDIIEYFMARGYRDFRNGRDFDAIQNGDDEE